MTRIPLANQFALPGIDTAVETVEKQVWYGDWFRQYFEHGTIDSTVVDAGNTPTTQLRAGLLLAKRTDGLYYNYDADGSGNAYDAQAVAVLMYPLNTLDAGTGVAVDHDVPVLVAGFLKADQIIGLDAQARSQLLAGGKFRFDDDPYSIYAFNGPARASYQLITNHTATAAQSGFLFVCTTADCNFTLPTIAPGLVYRVLMAANQELVITGASQTLITGNSLTSTTITATTTAEQIGICWRIESVYVGTTLKWLVTREFTAGSSAFTVGIA